MELYGSYTSPYVRQCRVVLLDTGVPCKFVETDVASSAGKTPTMRIPFLRDGDLQLNDSASICRHLRERAGQKFLPTVRDQELFSLAGTVLDSAINIFLFERNDGLLPSQSTYLKKQSARVDAGLRALDEERLPLAGPLSDAEIRLACLLGWGRFRKRFSIDGLDNLARFLEGADAWPPFAETEPPEGAPPPV